MTLISVLALAAAPLTAQTTLPDSIVRQVDGVYSKYASPNAPGCVVGVYQNGRIALAKGYGSANIEYAIPITPKTPFIMGSVSKQFTAAAIALLVEQGRIKLDDDVHRYVPELRDYGKKVTIDELVHHTSGIRDFWTLVQTADMRNDDGYTVDDILRLASRQKNLNFDPGAEYNYSNTGYVLLGVVVQRVTGKTLRQFADAEFFKPLGMTHSQFHDDHNEPVFGRAFAYSPAPKGAWKINIWNNDIVGQGGLVTTVEDLQKWDENFYNGTVGGRGLLDLQLRQGVLNDGTTLPYAFGLEVLDYRGLKMVEHTGSTGGYRTAITRFPTQHTSIATMCNVSTANTAALTHAVADVVLAKAFTKPAVRATRNATAAAAQQASAVSVTDSERSAFAGRYYSDELDATFEIANTGTVLTLMRARSGPDTLRAVEKDTFRSGGMTLKFAPGRPSAPSFTVDAGRARGIEFRRVAGAGN
jgi:CubicO group peptidase (beta-lactamase class C family)